MSAFADMKEQKTLNEWLHEIAFVTSTMSDHDEPQSFQEAWWDPDLIGREKWSEAICLEFKMMLDMGIWRHVNRKDHPQDRNWLGVDGYLRLSVMVWTMPDLWQKVSAKFLAWISQITIPQWSMMSLSELW